MSPLIAHYILSYFKNDATISACRTYIETQVFEGMYKMVIEVGLRGIGQNERPEFFNNDVFLELLQAFFSEARAYLYVISGVPLWFYSDPRVWLRLYMNARTARDRSDIGLPFGVMDLTKCYIKEVAIGAHGMHHAFKVVPVDGAHHPGLEYTLFNRGMSLVDIDPDVSKEAKKFYNRLPTETKQRIDTMTEFPRMAMPHSNFYDLVGDRKLVDQADQCMHDANWARAHPLAWLTSEPPAKLPGADSMTDDMLMGGGDIEETELAMRQRLSAILNENARHSVQRIQEQLNGVAPDPENNTRGLTRRMVQKRAYGRMDALDDAFVFDDTIRVAKIDPADVIIDMTILTKIYTERIYQQMGLPNDIFVTQRALSYRSNEGSKESLFSNSMSSMLSDPMHQRARIDQHIFERLFAHVGTAPFELYHMDKIIGMVEEKDRAMDALMNQVRAAISTHLAGRVDKDILYRETPAMIMKQIKAMLRADDEKKATATEDAMDVEGAQMTEDLREIIGKIKAALRLVKKFQVSAQGLHYYMLGLQSHNPSAQSIARLQFEEREEFVAAREQEEERFEMEHPPPAPAASSKPKAKKPAKKEKAKEKKKPKPEKKAEDEKKKKDKDKPEKKDKPAGEKKDKPEGEKKDKPEGEKKDKPEGEKKDKPKKKDRPEKKDKPEKKRKREESDSESEKPKKKKSKKDASEESDSENSDDKPSKKRKREDSDEDDSSDSDEPKKKKKKKKDEKE